MSKACGMIRRAMMAIAGNEALYLFAAFVVTGVLNMGPMGWYGEAVDLAYSYIVLPWGLALCLLRLARRTQDDGAPERIDIALLFALLAWIVVPFAIRFGLTFNNVTSWQGSLTAFFGIYAMAAETDADRRERHFNLACRLFAALGLVMGAALLWCAWKVTAIGEGIGGYGFGIVDGMYLCHGVHYNHTGMIAVCMVSLALAGMGRSKNPAAKALCLVSAVMMSAVAVLTQSRTSRYCIVIALAAAAYSIVLRRMKPKRMALRQIAAIACAGAVAVCSYGAAKVLSDAALAHYTAQRERATAEMADNAQGETPEDAAMMAQSEPAAQTAAPEAAQGQPVIEARAAVDGTLSGRTDVWKNLIDYWKRNPKYFLIGNGTGRTGSLVVEGTIHEANGAVMIHNAYLQYIADYGLIGFMLLMAFAASILPRVLRAFFDPKPGELGLCMMVLCNLFTGLMESQPLGAMTPINMVFFFALGMLTNPNKKTEA